ncbi:MAG: hypothetical protein ACKVHE_07260 [Planctomycetales bacterium]
MSTTYKANNDSKCISIQKLGKSSSLFACVVLGLSGCTQSGNDDPVVPPVPVADSVSAETPASDSGGADGESKHRHYEGIGFAIPNSWQEIPNAKMVDSKYIIPTEHGDMEMTLTSMGGGADGNINRWVGQVGRDPNEEPSFSTIEVAGIKSRMVDVRGSFNSTVGANKGPQEDWRLIGLVVPLQRDFTMKLVGPREAVVEFKDELDAFLKSAHTDH